MKKAATLRAGPEFQRTLLQGVRIEGRLLRCHYLFHQDEGTSIRVGYAVPSRYYHAVRRNRIRRLLREAFAVEQRVLHHELARTSGWLSVIFLFKGSRQIPVEYMTLQRIQTDLAALCRAVAAQLELQGQCQHS